MKPLVVITGPTAVGKTELSIKIAKAIDGEIISADSIQVYKHMDIGSAKITKEEMQGIKHYLVDEFEPDEEFNVHVFKEKTFSLNMDKAKRLGYNTSNINDWFWKLMDEYIARALRENS